MQYNNNSKIKCILRSYYVSVAFYLLAILQCSYCYYPLFTHEETETQFTSCLKGDDIVFSKWIQ